jgi:hypothetical protein
MKEKEKRTGFTKGAPMYCDVTCRDIAYRVVTLHCRGMSVRAVTTAVTMQYGAYLPAPRAK